MVFVFPVCAFHTNRLLVTLAEHRQRLLVFAAVVTDDETARIRQLVFLQRWIPQVWCEVQFTIRSHARQTRLDRWGFLSAADVTGNFVSRQKLDGGICSAFRGLHILPLRPLDFNEILLNLNEIKIFWVYYGLLKKCKKRQLLTTNLLMKSMISAYPRLILSFGRFLNVSLHSGHSCFLFVFQKPSMQSRQKL